jgi:alpha-beta hydrolase superfamily lysophospholipase
MKKLKLKIKALDKKIGAQLDYPSKDESKEFAIFAHCFTCTKDLKSINYISEALTGKGIAVLRFDFTGLGESSGDFGSTNFESNIEDLIIVSEFMKDNFKGPKLLVGHSLGGAAVIQAAPQIHSCKAIATIGTPFYPERLIKIINSGQDEIKKSGRTEVIISGRNYSIGKNFYNDLKITDMKKTIENLNKPICVLHSPADETVGIEQAFQIFDAAKHPKSFISLVNADHLLLNKSDAYYAGAVIGEWALKYF